VCNLKSEGEIYTSKFYKVSKGQYEKDGGILGEYDDLKLPKRGTTGSAGYDFFCPISFELNPGEEIKIPTGIRVELDDDKVLLCHMRSSLGFKYRLWLNNVTGVIDSDYFHAMNEGHIFAKLYNGGDKVVSINKGDAFMQGIIQQYFKVEDDEADAPRIGGIGSTGK
jgi:dUTP pyrophosphatase